MLAKIAQYLINHRVHDLEDDKLVLCLSICRLVWDSNKIKWLFNQLHFPPKKNGVSDLNKLIKNLLDIQELAKVYIVQN